MLTALAGAYEARSRRAIGTESVREPDRRRRRCSSESMPRRRADRFAAARGSGMRGARRGRPPGRRPCGSGRSGGPHPPARGGSWLPTRRAAHHWPALANFRTGVPVGRRCSRPLAGSATWAIAEATPVDMSSYTVFTRARGPASPRRLPSTGGATGPVAERTLGRRGCRARGRPVLVRRCSAESGSPKGALNQASTEGTTVVLLKTSIHIANRGAMNGCALARDSSRH